MQQANVSKSKKWHVILMTCLMAAGLFRYGGMEAKAEEQAARVGEIFYETLEEAFQAAGDGETIYLQKNTALSGTITISGNNLILTSEDEENPCTVIRSDEFDTAQPLISVESGSFTTRNIVMDGQAVIDKNFVNTGKTASNSLIVVKNGTYTMEQGTILQNNYNTDGAPDNMAKRTAGAVHVSEGGTFILTDGLIQNCYTNGYGGGILVDRSNTSIISGGKITHCKATLGGAIYGEADISIADIEISENRALYGGGIYARGNITISGSEISNNSADATAGGISCKVGDYTIQINDCILSENKANSGAAIDATDNSMTGEVIIDNCQIINNENLFATPGAVYFGTKGKITLEGDTSFSGNTKDGEVCDFYFGYGSAGPLVLGTTYTYSSPIVFSADEDTAIGRCIVDGQASSSEISKQNFTWLDDVYPIRKDGNTLYLGEEEETEPEPVKTTYTVTFEADGGTCSQTSLQIKIGESFLLPNITRSGYDFIGWYLAPESTICVGQEGESASFSQDVTLIACYQKQPETVYTVTFAPNGGTCTTKETKITGTGNITLPKATRTGYSFTGWFTANTGGTLIGQAGNYYYVTKNTTLYAQWQKDSEEQDTCTVSFYLNGGTSTTKDFTIIKGNSMVLPLPERSGYDFLGWYLENDFMTFAGTYQDTYTISQDTSFYAKWKQSGDEEATGNGEQISTYTIQYDANGGQMVNTQQKVIKGGSVKLPSASRDGYTFKGWYTENQVYIGTEGDRYKPVKDIGLYAKWEKEAGIDGNENSTNSVADSNNYKTADQKDDTGTQVQNGRVEKEAVVQTGYASHVMLLFLTGIAGTLLAASSCKKKSILT